MIYFLFFLIGISLGLLGTGGAILAVPSLVYILGIDKLLATTYSLFIISCTTLVGSIRSIMGKMVHWQTYIYFCIPSVIAVILVRRFLLPIIPHTISLSQHIRLQKGQLIMLLFAGVLLLSAKGMLQPIAIAKPNQHNKQNTLLLLGSLIGLIIGLLGAGGGFIAIPAMVVLLQIPMHIAIGTSLLIICTNSAIGFITDTTTKSNLDWNLLVSLSAIAIAGIFVGGSIQSKINAKQLKFGFGILLIIIAIGILTKELLF